jgi:2-iminobutanoate/2-iminopropanoate deaminase
MRGLKVATILVSCLLTPIVAGEEKSGRAVSRVHVIATNKAPKAVGPYSQAIRTGGFIFCSGQGAFDPANNQLVAGGIKEQTRQVLRNLQAVLEAGGSGLDRVVKVTVFLSDWKYFKEMNEAYAEFFDSDRPPARSTVQGERWPEGHLVAMEAIAIAE